MRSILQAVQASPVALNNTSVRLQRVIGTIDIDGKGTQHAIAAVDPFIFLDEAEFEGQISSSFTKHPHTGLTAVTYLLEGTAHAWDNMHGATPELNQAGGVYCIAAGKGIVHGEAPVAGIRKVRLLQMWFNPGIYELPLPKSNYQLFQPQELPIFEDEGLWAKVIIGAAFQLKSPVLTPWPIQYLHVKLAPQQNYSFPIPEANWQGFIYILEGQGIFGSNKITGKKGQCLVLGEEQSLSIPMRNNEDTPLVFLVATGQPHQKSFYKLLGYGGALVANTESHARSWMQDYENNPDRFGLD